MFVIKVRILFARKFQNKWTLTVPPPKNLDPKTTSASLDKSGFNNSS